MNRSPSEILGEMTRKPKDHPYDGVIAAVFPDYVHVRLAGSARKIITNVIIANHINKDVLKVGLFCKVRQLYERSESGRFLLTDLLPQVSQGDYAGGGTGIPNPPLASADGDCTTRQWTIRWSGSVGATQYEVYWATDNVGTNATLITKTTGYTHTVNFDTNSPPRVYFAVKAVSGLSESNLSSWVTDLDVVGNSTIVTFGDDYSHGHLTTAGNRWRVKQGVVELSTNNGGSWNDVSPADDPPDDFTQSPAPTVADVDFIQVLGDDDEIIVIGGYSDGTIDGGWFATTDDNGETWTWHTLNDGATDIIPIWGAVNDTWLFITAFFDDDIEIYILDRTGYGTLDYYETVSDTCTKEELADRTWYVFPVTVADDDEIVFICGRIYASGDVVHIQKCTIDGGEISDADIVENGWGTDYCSAFYAGPDDGAGNRNYYAVRE